MTRSTYDALPEAVQATVEIVAVCPSRETVEFVLAHLPQAWRDVTLAWTPGSKRAVEVVILAREDPE
jgi:hypothetical protein